MVSHTLTQVADRLDDLASYAKAVDEAESEVTLVATRLDELAKEHELPDLERLALRLWALL